MKTDVLIIGGGPAGCAAAMFLAKEGVKPIILEQEEFPRFHIGESMTGEAGAALRRLGLEEQMLRGISGKHGVRVSPTSGSSGRAPILRLNCTARPVRSGGALSTPCCPRSSNARKLAAEQRKAFFARRRGSGGVTMSGPME